MATITIYTTPYCPYCQRAKQLLDSKEVKYEEIDVSDRSLRPNMTKITGGTTVPQIIIDGKPKNMNTIAIIKLVSIVIENGMNILNVSLPKKM